MGTPPIVASPDAPTTTNAPISGDLQPPPATSPVSLQSPPPPAAGQPSVWKNIVMGAIYGLAGSAGQTHFGGGLAAGAGGVIQAKQRDLENKQRGQQLQMESVRAADTHIAALDEHNRAQRLDSDAKLDYAQKSANYQAFLQDNFGIEPNLSFNDAAEEASAAHNTLAGQNGGTIPPVATVQQPAPDGTHGKVAVYSPSQQQMQQNANGFRELINTQRAVQGQPPIDNATFNSLGFKGQRDAAQQAINFLKPTPSFSMDKNKPDYLPAVLAQRQQQLAQYQAHKDANGNPDANPNVQKQLQDSISYLQNTWDSVNKQENKAASDAINATAGAKANAAALEAKAKLPYELAKVKAEQAVKDGDPTAAGRLLATGVVAPSQIISARNPAFAQQAFDAANGIDPNWNAQTAEGYFKTASTPANVTFFGSAKSLTDPNGTLDQLASQFAKLPNGQIPAFNKLADWKSAATGKGAMAGFAQTALGVADDYAKVMGGGQGSDTAREEVLQSFAASHSPDQMAAAISAARGAVNSQIESRIGGNPVMRNMFGKSQPVAQPVYASAPGKPRVMSTDGGKTWQPAPAQ
jgi:hypothetical protein